MSERDIVERLQTRADYLRETERWLLSMPITERIDTQRRVLIAAQLRGTATEIEGAIERLRSAPGETPTGSEAEVKRLRGVFALAAQAIVDGDPDEAYHRLYWSDGGKSRGAHLIPAGGSTTPEEQIRWVRCPHIGDACRDTRPSRPTANDTPYHEHPVSAQPKAPGETEVDRQWHESGMWQEWLAGYERVSDDERAEDPRYMSVERWTYRLLTTGHCPGSLPVAHAIIEDLDALAAPTHDLDALREALEEIARMGCENWPDGHSLTCACNPCIARRALSTPGGDKG